MISEVFLFSESVGFFPVSHHLCWADLFIVLVPEPVLSAVSYPELWHCLSSLGVCWIEIFCRVTARAALREAAAPNAGLRTAATKGYLKITVQGGGEVKQREGKAHFLAWVKVAEGWGEGHRKGSPSSDPAQEMSQGMWGQGRQSTAHPALALEPHLSQLCIEGSVTGAVFSMDEIQGSNLE